MCLRQCQVTVAGVSRHAHERPRPRRARGAGLHSPPPWRPCRDIAPHHTGHGLRAPPPCSRSQLGRDVMSGAFRLRLFYEMFTLQPAFALPWLPRADHCPPTHARALVRTMDQRRRPVTRTGTDVGSQQPPSVARAPITNKHEIYKIHKERPPGIGAVSCVPQPLNQLRSQVTGQCVVATAPAQQAFSTQRRSAHAISARAVTYPRGTGFPTDEAQACPC